MLKQEGLALTSCWASNVTTQTCSKSSICVDHSKDLSIVLLGLSKLECHALHPLPHPAVNQRLQNPNPFKL